MSESSIEEKTTVPREETFTVYFDGHLCGELRCENPSSRVNIVVKDGNKVVFLVSFARKIRVETDHKTGRAASSYYTDIQELHNEVTLYNCDAIKTALRSAFDAHRDGSGSCTAWMPTAEEWCLSRVNWLMPVVETEKQREVRFAFVVLTVIALALIIQTVILAMTRVRP